MPQKFEACIIPRPAALNDFPFSFAWKHISDEAGRKAWRHDAELRTCACWDSPVGKKYRFGESVVINDVHAKQYIHCGGEYGLLIRKVQTVELDVIVDDFDLYRVVDFVLGEKSVFSTHVANQASFKIADILDSLRANLQTAGKLTKLTQLKFMLKEKELGVKKVFLKVKKTRRATRQAICACACTEIVRLQPHKSITSMC